MNTKEYLMQLKHLRLAMQKVEEQISEIRNTMTQLSAIRYDKEHVQQTPDDIMLNCIVRIEAAEEKYVNLLEQYNERYTIMLQQIEGMENELQKNILLLRYMYGLPLHIVADKLGYSFDWIRHVHQRALRTFQEKYLKN